MEHGPVRELETRALLGRALSDDLRSVALLACSLDASWSYEGYDAYRSEDLGTAQGS
jgi:cell filamentation protein